MEIGVIGFGLRGGLSALAHQPDHGIRVTTLADPSPRAKALFAQRFGESVTLVDSVQELLDRDLDAVFVLSPDYLHEEHAIACLQAGIAVYLEKPMAITVEGCDRILKCAEQTGTKLYLGHNMRHFEVVKAMKRWIDAGHIGEPKTAWCRQFVSYGGDAYFCDWHAERRYTTGLFLQKGAHDIDVLHHLCGGYASRVSAMGKLMVYGDALNRREPGTTAMADFRLSWPPAAIQGLNPVIDIEDVNMLTMELDNGVLAAYQQCHFTPDAWRNYTVIGSEGRIENLGDGPGGVVKLWNKPRYGYSPEADLEFVLPEAEGGHGGSDALIVDEFLRFVREDAEPSISPVAARMAVAAGVAATESLRNGSVPIDVTPLPKEIAFVRR
jgi:predicted dehydrogenase